MENNFTCSLSIIIVNYNSLNYLRECLLSMEKHAPLIDKKYEIIVVDNASSDGSVQMVKKEFSNVRLIVNEKNTGFAAANNIAIKNSSSDYILLINSDCEVYKDSISNLLSFMPGRSDCGIAGPRIINSDGSIQYSCRRFPSLLEAGMHTILSSIKPDNPFSQRYKLAGINREEPFEVDWVSGSCMLIRRSALEDAGLMDENYFMYVEDIDICFQMWKKGWKVYYNPYSQILHHTGGSTNVGKTASSVRMQKSVMYFFWKNYKRTYKVIFLPLIAALLGLRILLTFFKNLLK